MSRAVEVGGRQGRGNPLQRGKPAQPDALSFAIAAHIREATPGILPQYDNPHALAWMRWRMARLRAWAALRFPVADARPWRPWWPGAARHWRGNVECGCGDCRAYVMEGGEGFTGRDGAHYPRQPAAWLAAGGVPMHRPKVAA